MDDTRNPLATRFLAFKELRCCPISGYNHWAAENQWIHRLMPLSSQATVQSIHHICYQKLPATTGKCFFFFFFNHFPRCGHYYSCWHHFSDTNITNEILFLCSSCLTLWAWQCFLGLHRNSCQKSGLDYSNIPGWDRAIFHREAYLISTLGNLFTSLFSREQSSNFRPSGGLFNHRVPPSTFSFSLFSLLVVFFFFLSSVFYWTNHVTLTLLLNMFFLTPGKPYSSLLSNSKPANCSSFFMSVLPEEHFPNVPK